jgi:hypothetical protein
MSTTYHYAVLRLAPDKLRGEIINVGVMLFVPEGAPRVIPMAPLNKLQAVDADWDTSRLAQWFDNIESIIGGEKSPSAILRHLSAFGFCNPEATGFFSADSPEDVQRELTEIRTAYVSNKALAQRRPQAKRTRLQTAMRRKFEHMRVLGKDASDMDKHLVVPNMPVPDFPELHTDFIYKNGVYRVTQTLDYNVSAGSVHNKLQEACVKITVAEQAVRAYGDDTVLLVVLDIPDGLRQATDNHVDLLLARGFEVFNFHDDRQMADYASKAVAPVMSGFNS